MTIIQAQPLKQFGISGPASALDNEVPVFDGITGKKIKAATGIICPSSGRLDLAEIRAKDGNGLKLYDDGGNGIFVEDGGNVGIRKENPLYSLDVDELGNSAGNLKIQADIQGDVTLFQDGLVGDTESGKSLYLYRGAPEGTSYMRMYFNEYKNMLFASNESIQFGGKHLYFYPDTGIINFGRSWSSGQNDTVQQFGWLTAKGAASWIKWQVADTTDNFELTRQDSNIGYFDIQMPTIITGGNVGIVTIDPTAKLDIDSDILRLRTAKTPATAGAAGNQGDMCWDANYIYACTATNTWKRTALTTW